MSKLFGMASKKNGPHHTDGHYYRTPSDPQLVSALGRAQLSLSYIEYLITLLLFEAGRDFKKIQELTAISKVSELRVLKLEIAGWGASDSLLKLLQGCIDVFNNCRKDYHNVTTYLNLNNEGIKIRSRLRIKLTSRITKKRSIKITQNLHRIAVKIEKVMDAINSARITLVNYWKRQLQHKNKFKITTNSRHFLIRAELEGDTNTFFTFVNGYGIIFRVNEYANMAVANKYLKRDKELLEEIASRIEKYHE